MLMNITIFMKNLWNFRRKNFNLRTPYIIPFLLLALLTTTSGCKKDINSINSIGLNLRGNLLNPNTDTTLIVAYSVLEDSLNTTNLVFNYLGTLKDNIFGITTAGIYTQIVPSGNNANFGGAQQCDSVVLTLRYYGGFYGDTLNPFKIKVYELDEKMESSKTYYQTNTLSYIPKNLTEQPNFTLYPKPNTKVHIDTTHLEAHIRIRLKNHLGDRFLQNTTSTATPEAFKDFFKGLYICAESSGGDGSLVNVNLTHSLSGIKLYYTNNDGEAKQFSFEMSRSATVRFSHYEHNYNIGTPENTLFVNQVVRENKDTMLGQKMLYVQSMGGVKTKISFPNLKKLKERKIVINKAELVITDIGEDLSVYPSPLKLTIQGVNPSGTLVLLPDDQFFTNQTYWGGGYDATKKEYKFRITRYIEDIIQRDNFKPYIYLVTTEAAANANRLLLGGTNPDNISSKLRLDIYYTEY
jgi:hypothetical protein